MARYGWSVIEEVFPKTKATGRPPMAACRVMDGVCGGPWCDLPQELGSWEMVFAHFHRWSSDGTLAEALAKLKDRFSRDDLFDHSVWSIDGTIVWVHRCAGGGGKKGIPKDHAHGRSRGGIFDKTPCDLRWRGPAAERRSESGANVRNATLRRAVEHHRSDQSDIEAPPPT
jgi:Putative transposase of IS4/5 family (DUF4096)